MNKLRRPKHQIALELNDESGQIAISMPRPSNRRKGHGDDTGSNARRHPAEPRKVLNGAYRGGELKVATEALCARIRRESNFESSSWKGEPMCVAGSGHELTLNDFKKLVREFVVRNNSGVHSNTPLPIGELPITGRGSLDDAVDGDVAPKSKSEGSNE